MATFVLVHGAWHGGWCWTKTQTALRNMGHDVHSPTLTGLGERSHLLSANITADTHAQDIANVLRWRELKDVILVGHSYGGSVITGAASQRPDDIRALVYLDAFVPERSGQAVFANANPARMAAFQKRHYILAARNTPSPFVAEYERVKDKADWTSETINTLHDAMVEAPYELAQMLDAYAATLPKETA